MPEVVIGTSPRNSTTDSSGLRFYQWQRQKLVSVTTVRRMAGIPFGLHYWAIGQVIDYVIVNGPEIGDRIRVATTNPMKGSSAADADLAELKREIRRAATAERDRAAELGTAVHDAAATGQRLDLVAPELRPRLVQFYDFLAVSGIEVVAAEFQVWNPTVGYGGTVDFLGRHRNGTLRVIDLKTGKGIYNDHALQVTAYDRAEFAGNDDTINEPLTAMLHQTAAPAILHLADDGWEFLVLRPDEELGAWRAFRGLMAFSMWSYDHAEPETFTAAKREGRAEIPAVAAAVPEMAPVPAGAAIPAPAAPTAATGATAATAEVWTEPGPVHEPTAAEIAAVEAALVPPTVPRTAWCVDFLAHQHAHRQVAQDTWQCDLCVAILPPAEVHEAASPAAIAAMMTPVLPPVDLVTAAETSGILDTSLSRDEFKAMVRAAGIEPPFLLGVARELWPAVANMQSLDDAQRGRLYDTAAARWSAR